MHFGAPEIIWAVITGLNIVFAAILDGKPKEGKHRFGVTFVGTCGGAAMLWWGGFFS